MSVRIATTIVGERTFLQISGRLQSCEVPELDKEIRLIAGRFVLDLSELISADKAAIKRLRELASSRIALQGVSHYVQLLLDDKEST